MTERQATGAVRDAVRRSRPRLHRCGDRATDRRARGLADGDVVPARHRLVEGSAGRRTGSVGGSLGVRWAAAALAVVLIGVVGVAVLGRSSIRRRPAADVRDSSTPSPAASPAPIPDVLRHSWQRPYAVTPGPDQWAYRVPSTGERTPGGRARAGRRGVEIRDHGHGPRHARGRRRPARPSDARSETSGPTAGRWRGRARS